MRREERTTTAAGRIVGRFLLAMVLLAAPGAAVAQPAGPRVRILAYINVTSGCQASTVRHLEEFAAKHPGDVALEIVDFGSVEGAKRWHADGHNCEVIVVNGSSQFRVGSGSQARLVVLRNPEGVRWTFPDLDAVLARELRAPGSAVVSEAEAAEVARQTPVSSRRGEWKGKPVGEVIVGAQVVFRFNDTFAGKSPVRRAQDAAVVLKRLYAGGLSSTQVRAADQDVPGGKAVGAVVAGQETIAVVTESESAVVRRSPQKAARLWAFNLREALRFLGR